MTTTPAIRHIGTPIENGIRPFDLARDLRPVADLISRAFAHELDNRGTAILREMRFMSYMAGIMRLFSGDNINYDDVFSGFVWVHEGKVIGNVTVQRGDGAGRRWQIANVAVASDFRGRGIAQGLLTQALEHIHFSNGDWAVLQVYENNHVARHLYEKVGFDNMGGSVELRLQKAPPITRPPIVPSFGTYKATHWRMLYQLAGSMPDAHAEWWRSLKRTDFQMTLEDQMAEWMWRLAGRTTVLRRCIRTTDRFEAALELTAQRWQGEHKLQLWVRPEHFGKYEEYFAHWVLSKLQDFPRFPISLTISTEHIAALDSFQRFGFQRRQALLTMRRKV
ncbi:MAG: GNAT family N-acetyltransferase [Chloroflexota bacterium]